MKIKEIIKKITLPDIIVSVAGIWVLMKFISWIFGS